MNRQMWDNPATQRNVAQFVADGVAVLGPTAATRPAAKPATAACWSPRRSAPTRDRARPAQAPRRQARAGHRRADLRGDRPGARHHQFEFGQDGLRAGARRAEAGADVTLVSRADRAGHARGVTRVDVRRAPQRWSRPSTPASRAATSSSPSRPSPTTRPLQPSRAQDQEGRRAADADAGAEPRHPRAVAAPRRARRSASASPPRARTSRSTRRTSGGARTCR